MKTANSIFLFSLLSFSRIGFATQTKIEISQTPASINVNNYNTIEAVIDFTSGLKKCAEWVLDGAKQQLEDLTTFISNHRIKLILGFAVGSYAYSFSKFFYIGRFIDKGNLWSSWKSEYSLKELLSIPQEEITRELLCAIQLTHVSKCDPLNAEASIRLFIKKLEAEKKMLWSYATFHSLLSKLKIQRLFFSCVETKEQIEERIKKLVYFKNLFSTWIAEYKFKKLKNEIADQDLTL